MLPRGVEFVKILHSKQRIISQRAVSQFKSQLFTLKCSRQIVESRFSDKINKNVLILQRLYTTKDKVIRFYYMLHDFYGISPSRMGNNKSYTMYYVNDPYIQET